MTDAARAHAILTELRSMGVRVALDDFGTGHSSLAYLSRLPVDELKIDRSFVMRLADDPLDRSVVRSTIELAHDLGLRVVAEGVEDQAAWDWLAAHGCDEAQGWLMGRPIPADVFEATLRDGPRAPRREPVLVA